MSYFELTPEYPPDCPMCKGTGYFEQPQTMCNDCPFGTRDCTECIAKKDHLVDHGIYCELCGGLGYVSEAEAREFKNGFKH